MNGEQEETEGNPVCQALDVEYYAANWTRQVDYFPDLFGSMISRVLHLVMQLHFKVYNCIGLVLQFACLTVLPSGLKLHSKVFTVAAFPLQFFAKYR